MILLLMACGSGIERFDDPIPARDPWDRADADAETQARIDAAWSYSQEHSGLALIVVQGETVIFEDYAGGHTNETPYPFWSGTKTFGCVMATLGQDQGLLTLDERVAETVPAWQEIEHNRDVELQHLLHFTSGLPTRTFDLGTDGFKPVDEQRIADKYAYALELEGEQAPGAQWVYGSQHLAVFGAVMEIKLGESPLDWLDREILNPIDMRRSGWNHDPDGNPMFAYGLWTSAPELTKLGVLLRDDGMFQGERLLPQGSLDACMQGTDANPAYGLGSWLNEDMDDDVVFDAAGLNQEGQVEALLEDGPDMLAAAGAGGQRIYVIPELDWVVVHQADQGRSFHDPVFLDLLLR